MTTKEAKYKAQSIKLAGMLEKTLQQIQIYNLRQKQHQKEKEIMTQQIDIQNKEIFILKAQLQQFHKTGVPRNFVGTQAKNSEKYSADEIQSNLKKIQKMNNYHSKLNDSMGEIQKLIDSLLISVDSKDKTFNSMSRIVKKINKYHHSYIEIQQELITSCKNQESLKIQINKLIEENVELMEKGKRISPRNSKEKGSRQHQKGSKERKSRQDGKRSRSIEALAKQNNTLRQQILRLQREVETLRDQKRERRLSPFQEKNKKLLGSQLSSMSRSKSKLKPAGEEQNPLLNPLQDISAIDKPNISLKDMRQKQEQIRKLQQKIQKLQIENRTIKNIHQQTMRKIELDHLNGKEDEEQEEEDMQEQQKSQNLNYRRDSALCKHRNSITSGSQHKRRKSQVGSSIEKDKKVWAKKYQQLFQQIRLLNKQILVHEQAEKEVQEQLAQTIEKLQGQMQKATALQKEKLEQTGQIQLLTKSLCQKQSIIEQQKQTIRHKTQEINQLSQEIIVKENGYLQQKAALREEITAMKLVLEDKNEDVRRLEAQLQEMEKKTAMIMRRKEQAEGGAGQLRENLDNLMGQLAQAHKKILQQQNESFQLSVQVSQSGSKIQQLTRQLNQSKQKSATYIKSLHQQNHQLKQYIAQLKQQTDKLVVKHNQSQMTINKLQDSIAMIKKQLNELVGSWGVDNVHLLLAKFKEQFREATNGSKALKEFNAELLERNERLERLLEKAENKESQEFAYLRDEIKKEKKNEKLSLDMWKAKLLGNNGNRNKVQSFNQLLQVVYHNTANNNQYFPQAQTPLSPQPFTQNLLYSHIQQSPKSSRVLKDPQTISQRSSSKKFSTYKKQQLFNRYTQQQYKQLEQELTQLKKQHKLLQDQVESKEIQLKKASMRVFQLQTRIQEVEEESKRILAYGKEKEEQARVIKVQIENRVEQGRLEHQNRFTKELKDMEQQWTEEKEHLIGQYETKISNLIKEHQETISKQSKQNQDILSSLAKQHQQRLTSFSQQHQLTVQSLNYEFQQNLTKLKQQNQQNQQNLKAQYHQQLQTLQQKISFCEQQLSTANKRCQEKHLKHSEEIDQLQQRKSQQIGQLKDQHQKILEQVQQSYKKKIQAMCLETQALSIEVSTKIRDKQQIIIANLQVIARNKQLITNLEQELHKKAQHITQIQQKLQNKQQQLINEKQLHNVTLQSVKNQLKTIHEAQLSEFANKQHIQLATKQNQIRQLTIEVNKLTYQLDQASEKQKQILQLHSGQVQQLNLQLNAISSKFQSNQHQDQNLTDTLQQVSNLQEKMVSLEQEIIKVQSQLERKERQCSSLLKQGNLMREKLLEYSQKLQKHQQQKQYLEQLKKQLLDKQRQLDNLSLKLWQLGMYKQKFQKIKSQNDELESKVQQLQSQLQKASNQLIISKKTLQPSHLNQPKQQIQLQNIHIDQSSCIEFQQIDKLHCQIKQLQQQLQKIQQLSQQKQQLKNDLLKELQGKQHQIEEMKLEVYNLKESNNALQEQYERLSDEMDRVKVENRKLKNQLKKERQTQRESRMKERQSLKNLMYERQEEKLYNSTNTKRFEQCLKEKDQLVTQNQILNSNLLRLKKDLQSLKSQLSTNTVQLQRKQQQITSLKQQNYQLNELVSQLKEEANGSNNDSCMLDNLKHQLEERNHEISLLKAEMSVVKDTNNNMSNNLKEKTSRQANNREIRPMRNFNVTESYKTIVLNEPLSYDSHIKDPVINNTESNLSSAGLLSKKATLLNTQNDQKQSKVIKRLRQQNLSYLEQIQYLKKFNQDLKDKNQQLYERLEKKSMKDLKDKSSSGINLSYEGNDSIDEEFSPKKTQANNVKDNYLGSKGIIPIHHYNDPNNSIPQKPSRNLLSPRKKNEDDIDIFLSQPEKSVKNHPKLKVKKDQSIGDDNWMVKRSSAEERQELLKASVHKISQENNILRGKVNSLNEQLTKANEQFKKVSSQLIRANTQFTKVTQEMYRIRQQNIHLKQTLSTLQQENLLIQQKYNLTLKKQQEIQERYNQIQTINKTIEEKLQEMRSMYVKAKQNVELLEVEKSQLMSENLKLSSQLSSLKTIYEEDQEGLMEKSQKIHELEDKKSQLQEKVEQLQSVIKELQEKLKNSEISLGDTQTKIKQLSLKLSTKDKCILQHQQKLQQYQRQLSRLKQQYSIAKQHNKQLQQQIAAYKKNSKDNELLSKITKLQAQLKQSNEIRTMYYNELKKNTQDESSGITNLKRSRSNSGNNTIVNLLNKIQEMTLKIQQLEKQNEEKDIWIKQNKDQISDLKRFIQENRSQVESIIEENIQNKTKIKQVQMMLTQKQIMLTQKQTQTLEHYQALLQLKQAEITKLKTKLQQLSSPKQNQIKIQDSADSFLQQNLLSNIKEKSQRCKICSKAIQDDFKITIHPVATRKNSNEFEKQLLWEIQTLKLQKQKLQKENNQLREKCSSKEIQHSVIKLSVQEESNHSNPIDTPLVPIQQEKLLNTSSEQEKNQQKKSGHSNSSAHSNNQLRPTQLKATSTSQLLIYSNNNKIIEQSPRQRSLSPAKQKQKPLRIIQSQSKDEESFEPTPTSLHPKTSVIDTLTHKLMNSEKIISLFKIENQQLSHQLEMARHKNQLLQKQLKGKIQEIVKMRRAIEEISEEIEFQKKRNKNFEQLFDKYRASVKKSQSSSSSNTKNQSTLAKSANLQGLIKKKQEKPVQKISQKQSLSASTKPIDKNFIQSKTKLTIISEQSMDNSSIKSPRTLNNARKQLSRTQLPLQKNTSGSNNWNSNVKVKPKISSPNEKARQQYNLDEDNKVKEKRSPRGKQTK